MDRKENIGAEDHDERKEEPICITSARYDAVETFGELRAADGELRLGFLQPFNPTLAKNVVNEVKKGETSSSPLMQDEQIQCELLKLKQFSVRKKKHRERPPLSPRIETRYVYCEKSWAEKELIEVERKIEAVRKRMAEQMKNMDIPRLLRRMERMETLKSKHDTEETEPKHLSGETLDDSFSPSRRGPTNKAVSFEPDNLEDESKTDDKELEPRDIPVLFRNATYASNKETSHATSGHITPEVSRQTLHESFAPLRRGPKTRNSKIQCCLALYNPAKDRKVKMSNANIQCNLLKEKA